MAEVWLYVYDLSNGLIDYIDRRSIMSSSEGLYPLSERRQTGIYHSSLVVHNHEIEYGPLGVYVTDAGQATCDIVEKRCLGKTTVSIETLMEYVSFLNVTKFKGENYNLFKFNCNVFTSFLAMELVGKDIPDYLKTHPRDITTNLLGSLAFHVFNVYLQKKPGTFNKLLKFLKN